MLFEDACDSVDMERDLEGVSLAVCFKISDRRAVDDDAGGC